tara:strand:+ start:439 stop:1806 length:1368 start_codon:yes stop_codon:yes gene_type:complete
MSDRIHKAPTGMIHKTIEMTEIKGVDMDDRSFWSVGSSENPDRDNEIIRQKGWKLKNFRKHPALLYAHNPYELPIGSAKKVKVEDEQLLFQAKFARHERADALFQMYIEGQIKGWSVGFMPLKWQKREDDDGEPIMDASGWWFAFEYLQQELIEISSTPVPANADSASILRSIGIPVAEDHNGTTRNLSRKISSTKDLASIMYVSVDHKHGITARIGITPEGKTRVTEFYFDGGKWDDEGVEGWIKEHGETVSKYITAPKVEEESADEVHFDSETKPEEKKGDELSIEIVEAVTKVVTETKETTTVGDVSHEKTETTTEVVETSEEVSDPEGETPTVEDRLDAIEGILEEMKASIGTLTKDPNMQREGSASSPTSNEIDFIEIHPDDNGGDPVQDTEPEDTFITLDAPSDEHCCGVVDDEGITITDDDLSNLKGDLIGEIGRTIQETIDRAKGKV